MSDQKNLLRKVRIFISSFTWFFVGFILTAVFLASFIFAFFQHLYSNKIYEGVFIENTYVGGKTKQQVQEMFDKENLTIGKSFFTFIEENHSATISASALNIGYDSKLMAEQAYSIGRSQNKLTNLYIIVSSYINGVFLPTSYTFSSEKLEQEFSSIQKNIYIEPVDALFTVKDNRVVAFKQSSDGRTIDYEALNLLMNDKIRDLIKNNKKNNVVIKIPIKILKSNITTEKANNLGIVEIIGEGKSHFKGSIPNRIHNVTLAASRLNGVLVAPGETFSFVKVIGDISKYTGYKEAYIIKDGRTVLGDGGGVCQVSTTFFRAILNAGLPITERHAHSYRVSYYEQDSPPGLDATVYVPTEDLKFKNDMASHILIQTFVDPTNLSISFILYGKKDGREVKITTPVITSQTSPPAPRYQDDPTLPNGTVRQVDFEAWGANVVFSRTVTKNGKVIINETFNSRYQPWQAVFLKGTS